MDHLDNGISKLQIFIRKECVYIFNREMLNEERNKNMTFRSIFLVWTSNMMKDIVLIKMKSLNL